MNRARVEADRIGELDGRSDKFRSVRKLLAPEHVSLERQDREADRIATHMPDRVSSPSMRNTGSVHRTETVAGGRRDLHLHAEAGQRNARRREPPSGVKTTDTAVFTADPENSLRAQGARQAAGAGARARYAGTVIASFATGYGLGATYEHLFGLYSLAVPIVLLPVAVALDLFANPSQPRN